MLLASAPLQAQQPVITSVVNPASYTAGAVVPGGIATLFGTGIVSASGILEAAAVPLPTALGGTQVLVNDIPAPLFAVANVNRQEQINFQVPWEVADANTITVVVVNGSARSAPRDYTVRGADLGLFTLDGASAIVVHGATNQLVTAASPAVPGEVVVFYATGLGAVDHAQQSGQPASLTELAEASNAVTVNIGGRAAAVLFAGLTPGSIGLYQVNCTVPADVGGGLYVVLTMLGQSSQPAKMPVRGGIAGAGGSEFVQIQPGEFTMGCSPGDGECKSNESPAHRVRITRGFQIGKYELTQEQWQAVMASNPSRSQGATLPVDQVSWDDVQEFLRRLNARNDGFLYRLPTEAEWEYAARAGTTGAYAGESPLPDVAWSNVNSGGQTHPAGQKQPNAWGLYDMLGNVFEWCQDWYGAYSSSAADNPTGPASGTNRMLRGGSWGEAAAGSRVSYRVYVVPESRIPAAGFRCVREVAASSCTGPAITTQPAGWGIAAGGTTDLTVTASGSAPLSYQWYEGARGTTTKPVGTNSATFRTPALTALATYYWVRVTNACGQVDSAAAAVSVTIGMEFVGIQPGEFIMGCSPGDGECQAVESPTHLVRITRGFQISKYEVTQGQWQTVMGSNPSYFKGATLPVEQVSWDDVQGFLQRLNDLNDGYRYRLPTEAEWEYAARAGSTDKYGDGGPLGDVAWHSGNSGSKTHPVGEKRPNAWGLYDTVGNVYEWCQDWLRGYSSGAADNSAGLDSGYMRIFRGGSWFSVTKYVRVSLRGYNAPSTRWREFGFRCVREVAASSCAGPAITTQPAGRSIAAGGTADLTVTASGSAPLSYQWYEGAKGTTTKRVGTNSATFRTPALTALATSYWVWVTNACGQVSSAAAAVVVVNATTGIEFVRIQPGEFTMGCSPGDSECRANESPAHPVRITKAFQIGKYEVTQEQWEVVMGSGSNPSYYFFQGAKLPVDSVSWDDVQGFLQRLNTIQDGYRYRLPTEAEWEYAARAGSIDKYGGGGALGDVAWYAGSQPHPVGQKRPNAWGLYDMLGNALEWCQDWYGAYSSSAADNPTGPASGTGRILRGGQSASIKDWVSVSFRSPDPPEFRSNLIGFRCVREAIP